MPDIAPFQVFEINPSSSENEIDGVTIPLTLADYSIRIDNATINCLITLVYAKGEEESFTLTSKSIIEIQNSPLKKIKFTDTNSYNLHVSQRILSCSSDEEYEALAAQQSLRFVI